MEFSSDNWAGASQPVMDALSRHNDGAAPAYGADPVSEAVTARFREVFETDVEVMFTATGTAANALAMAACARPGGLVFCSDVAHLHCDEWGAAEFFSHGMKLMPVTATHGKITAEDLTAQLAGCPEGSRLGRTVALSLTQASECGTVYRPEEIAALTAVARQRDMLCHMDGARFANALVHLGVTPAEMTWKAGIDVVSFGATKNGCWCAEALVVFRPEKLPDLAEHRARAGHVFSKSRFVAAQFDGYLSDDHWLDLARHANRAAARLAKGIAVSGTARLAWEPEANEVFAVLDDDQVARLKAAGARFYEWSKEGCGPREAVVRLVTSFRTSDAEVDGFLAHL